ncbi:hypothetical protein HD594_003308 [Microbacterium thalassium]|uniref:Uncharacterized protein n=1 Tax=Microbacterium thalassium TaxID=362649 RepID=A0A7X0FTP2_9MICO|nr:hypothetical protein [Microbacterium thalassium]
MSAGPTAHTPGEPRPLTLLGAGEYVCEGDFCALPAPAPARAAIRGTGASGPMSPHSG